MSDKILCRKCGGIVNPDIFTAPEMWCFCIRDVRGGCDCDHLVQDGSEICLICREPLKKKIK